MTLFLGLAIVIITVAACRWDFIASGKWYRVVLIALSGLFLLGYLFEPGFISSSKPPHYAVLTNGFDDDFSPSPYDSVYAVGEFPGETNPQDVADRWLSSAHFLENVLSAGSSINIYGYGLNEELPDQFHWNSQLRRPAGGIILENAPHQTETGKPFLIEFRIQGSNPADSFMVFRDGAAIYSGEAGSTDFHRAEDILFTEGPVSYRIEWLKNDGEMVYENWNVRAVQPGRLSIAALLYSPSFEINYLTQHYADRGHQVAARTRLGEDRFRYDNLNSPAPDAENIFNNLAGYDLLLVDEREFRQTDSASQQLILESVENGLDVLLLPPSSDRIEEWREVLHQLSRTELAVTELDRIQQRNWYPEFAETGPVQTSRIPLLDINFTGLPPEIRPLHHYQNRNPVSLRISVKNGSVSTHFFYNTYRWLLSGESELYNRFWSDYLGDIITVESPVITFQPQIPKTNEPLDIYISGYTSDSPVLVQPVRSGNEITLPVNFGPEHPDVGHSRFWPEHAGWHRVSHNTHSTWIYVYSGEWRFDAGHRTYEKNRIQIDRQPSKSDALPNQQNKKLPNWIWLIGFLALQGFLWLERKVN